MKHLLLAALLLVGCDKQGPQPIPTTTVRVSPGKINTSGDARLEVFTSDEMCESAEIPDAERDACKPYVDRASGTVHLAYRLKIGDNPVPMALRPEAVDVLHDMHPVVVDADDGKVKIIPHQESSGGQVYVLLIDGSGSMSEQDDGPTGPTRMDKLRRALLSKEVVDAFFARPQNVVVPLVFHGTGLPQPVGGRWLVQDRATYRTLIKDAMQVGSGYTYLYQAVQYASRGLAEVPELKQALTSKGTVVIALTDGFNDEGPKDTCGANAPRLETLVQGLVEMRRGKGTPHYLPEIFTVGLGSRAWPKFKLPEKLTPVDATKLCPRGFDGQIIDGYVERIGVDNATLKWIAEAGSGKSFVSRDSEGLAHAFAAAAEKRYDWFELQYRMEPAYLRRAFTTTIRLQAPFETESAVPISPNAWVDGPPGILGEDGWPRRASFRASLVLVMGTLSLLVVWNYLPAAVFNVRRAIFGLVDGGRRSKKTG